MCRRFALFFYAAIAVVSAHAAMAGEINGFESGKICRGGVINREQLIIHHGTVRAFKIAKLSNVRRSGIVRITSKRRHWTKNLERLCGTELAPLGESGGTVQLEIFAAVEMTLLIEMIVYG